MTRPHLSDLVVDHARVVVAAMLVLTAILGAGVPMVERSTSLDQFQGDTPESAAMDYAEANFTTEAGDGSVTQVVLRGEDVLDRESLVAVLEYQQTLRGNATVNGTLAEDGAMRSVANVVGTAAVRQERDGAAPGEAAGTARDGSAAGTPGDAGGHPTIAEQQAAIEGLSDAELDRLLERVLSGEGRTADALSLMPTDYQPGTTEADATLLVVRHDIEGSGLGPSSAPQSLVDTELAMATLAGDTGGTGPGGDSLLVFGNGIVSQETSDSMVDSVLLVGPLALLFVVVVLLVAYRDLLDVLLGVVGVVAVLVWTFGVMGWVGIAFNQPFVMVVVLLIGLSIDYAIHVVMRYREERVADAEERAGTAHRAAMRTALGSVGVALVLVTATTVIGFLSNLSSPLSVFRQIGVVSAIGITATLFVFGLLVPAAKVELDAFLAARGVDRDQRAIGSGGGLTTRLLGTGATLARVAPVAVIVVTLVVSAGGAYGATQVDTSFDQSDFLAEDPDEWLQDLPEPFAPNDYTAREGMAVLDDRFVRQDSTATVLVRGDVTDPATLDRLHGATGTAADLPVTQTYPDGEPAVTDPLSVMASVAAENDAFAATLADSDTDGDGVPDRNVEGVYDHLYRVAPEEATSVVHRTPDGDYRALRVVVSVDGSADGSTVTDGMRTVADEIAGEGVTATATGGVVVNAVTADQLLQTVQQGLVVALLAALVFLALAYRLTEGSASLGAVTILPVAFTVTWILGTMALLDVPFNVVTGLITSLTIGLGIDYSIHVSERFSQALSRTGSVDHALEESVTGTGGALLSSAVTTAGGFGVLTVALLPILQSFGFITALTIAFALVASVVVLPSLLALWARWSGYGEAAGEPSTAGEESATRADP